MNYTIQTHSNSGSFASPDGAQSLHYARNRQDAESVLIDWANDHPRMGADEHDATCLVWRGCYDDVSDLYPDWELTLGPRLGVHWCPC
jgi:hypothetical protein